MRGYGVEEGCEWEEGEVGMWGRVREGCKWEEGEVGMWGRVREECGRRGRLEYGVG